MHDAMALPAASAVPGSGGVEAEEPPPPAPEVVCHVRVADAQGLRLFRGGAIRLVITLRSIEDPDGEYFGLKVTPWQEVPQNCAPSWRPREAIFCVPAERCFSAEFVDSAHLHIALMQKEHALPVGEVAPPPAAPPRRFGLLNLNSALRPEGLAAALSGAVAAVQGLAADAVPDRGECLGTLRLPVGMRLVSPDATGGMEGLTWVKLVEPGDGGQKAKGSLLLELKTAHNHLTVPMPQVPRAMPSTVAEPPQSPSSGSGAQAHGEVPGSPHGSPAQAAEPSPLASEEGGDLSDADTVSESGMESDDFGASQASTSTPGDGGEAAARVGGGRPTERPLVERPLMLPPADARGHSDFPMASAFSKGHPANGQSTWLSSGKAGYALASDFDHHT